ncbi:MAG: tetratricopeptide repeat protein [Pseudomonadota bacterium]
MPRRLIYLLPLLTVACSYLPNAPEASAPEVKAATREPTPDELRGASFYYIMLAELAGRHGQFADAAALYLEAAKISRDPRVAERAARIALFSRDTATAEQALALWTTLEPEHAERWQAEILLHIRAGRETQALDLIDKQFPATGDRSETYRQIVAILALEGPGGMVLMHGVAQRHAEDGEAWFALAQLALQFRQLDTAEAALRKVIRLQPQRKEAYTQLAGTYFSRGDIEGGLKQVKETIAQFPDDQSLKLNYARALVESRRLDEARPLFDELLSKNPRDADLRYTVALLAMEGKDLSTAERELRSLLKMPEKRDAAAYYLGRLEEQRGREAEARNWYKRVGEGEMRIEAEIRLATLDAQQGLIEQARAHLSKAREGLETPEERVRLFLAEADLMKKAGQPEAAYELLSLALQSHPGAPDLLYTRALLADQLDRFPQTEADLRAILEQDPDHPEALNALGFTLAQRNMRLDEARELIEKALKLVPDSPAILDSMGWVLYRQGKLTDAETWLRKAYDRDQDSEIAAHLAEVLAALGRRDEALTLIDEALEREPKRRELLDLRQRLKSQP